MLVVKEVVYNLPNLEYFRDTLGWAIETEEDVLNYILTTDLITHFGTYVDSRFFISHEKQK